MLGKTIKYEFKATARVFLPMFAAILLMSIIAGFFYTSGLDALPNMIITMLLVMVFTAVWVMTIAILLRRFWNNILGREGYLMNVLPVSTWQHVFVKGLTATVWIIVGIIVSFVGIVCIVFLAISVHSLSDIPWDEIKQVLTQSFRFLQKEQLVGDIAVLIFQIILVSVSGTVFSVLQVYMSMALGQMVNKHRIWVSIGAYIGISIILSALASLLTFDSFYMTSMTIDVSSTKAGLEFANRVLLLGNIKCILGSIAFFFGTSLILSKKLNLQ